jgi:hypothetical protein
MTQPGIPDGEKFILELMGNDGNAFAVMGAVTSALRKAGRTNEEVHEYQSQAMSGDYNHLLAISMQWVLGDEERQ